MGIPIHIPIWLLAGTGGLLYLIGVGISYRVAERWYDDEDMEMPCMILASLWPVFAPICLPVVVAYRTVKRFTPRRCTVCEERVEKRSVHEECEKISYHEHLRRLGK